MQSEDEASVSYWDVDGGGNVSQITITGASIIEREDPYWDFEKAFLAQAMTFSSALATKIILRLVVVVMRFTLVLAVMSLWCKR